MRPEVEREWDFAYEPREEYVFKVVTDPGVRSVELEDAMRTCAQLLHDVATNEGIAVRVVVGMANQQASYVPSLSMFGFANIAALDNRSIVVAKKATDDTIYVKGD